jgi:prepilin-type N-terminal cleavage/methylation domain-containing protein
MSFASTIKKQFSRPPLQAQGVAGFTFIEILVAMSISGVVALAASTVVSQVVSSNNTTAAAQSLDEIRRNIISTMGSPASITNILADRVNSAAGTGVLNCVANGTPCSNAGMIDLMDGNTPSNLVVSADLSKGLTSAGKVCSGFTSATPNPSCPYQVQIWWAPQCAGGSPPCINPQWRINAKFIVPTAPGTKPLNMSRYNIEIYASYTYVVGDVTQVAAGADFACALTETNQVKCWGNNAKGQLGSKSAVGFSATPALVVNASNTPLANIQEIGAGTDYACAIDSSQVHYCWGNNQYGQLGADMLPSITPFSNVALPVFVDDTNYSVQRVFTGSQAFCQRTIGIVSCINCAGRMGMYDFTTSGSGEGPTHSAANFPSSPGLLSNDWVNMSYGVSDGNGAAWTSTSVPPSYWGYYGGAGTGNQYVVNPGDLWFFTSTWAPNNPTSTRFAGSDMSGTPETPMERMITMGTNVICFRYYNGQNAWNAGGTLNCTGINMNGELGFPINTTDTYAPDMNRLIPAVGTASDPVNGYPLVSALSGVGVLPIANQRYTNATTQGLDLNYDPAVVAGSGHLCALINGGDSGPTTPGRIACWGNNASLQLGRGALPTPYYEPQYVQSSSGVDQTGFTWLAAGGSHNCAVDNTGAVYCWGTNTKGELGMSSGGANQGNAVKAVDATTSGFSAQKVSVGTHFSCALDTLKIVHCWGDNSLGQLGPGAASFSSASLSFEIPL